MNFIYTNKRDNSRYILDPQTNMGSKVCLVNLTTCEDKFVSISTLKRWYSLTRAEDIYVQVKAFTGMNIGLYPIQAASETELYVITKSGKALWFNTETLVQTNAKNPKFANKLGLDYNYLESTLEWAIS